MATWDINEIMKLTLFGMFALLGISFLASKIFGFAPIQGGPLIQLLVIGSAILLIYGAATKKNFDFDKTDIFALLLVTVLISIVLFVLPEQGFEWFSVIKVNTVQSVMSLVGS